jgi:hypothetical protein
MENQIMKALYHLRKNQIVLSYRLNPEKSGITASQAYAWSHDCYPFFHVDDENDEAELYLDYFKVKKDFVTKVIEYLDAEWLENRFHTFYELEDKFGRNRVELINILRYCFLDDRFGQKSEFWATLKKDCPAEAHHIDSELDEWDI